MKSSNSWIKLLGIIALVVSLIITANVFLVTVYQYHIRSDTNLKPYTESANLKRVIKKANRGFVYDANKEIIAQDVKTYNIVCVLSNTRPSPKGKVNYVEDPVYTSRVLATLLEENEMKLYTLLTQDTYQTELGTKGRNLTKEKKEEIQSYNLPGVEFTESIQRSYPLNSFASYLIGYAQGDENGTPVGMMGIELYLNDVLMGTDGYREFQADKNGYVLPGMKEEEVSAINGNDVYLTIDRDLQETLELSFAQSAKENNATKAWGSVMEADTGKILAWGQSPSFNPNELVISDYNNYGSQYAYEAGSVIKVFTYAAAINEGNYNGEALVNSDPYCYVAKGTTPVRTYSDNPLGCINNARKKKWGYIGYDYGLIFSANTITSSLITEVITPEIFEQYMDDFGFFKKVETDGILEVEGTKNYTWPSDKLALSYGQGSSTTMLQMLRAFSAIFNDGMMVKPYYIESIKDNYDPNIVYYQGKTEELKQVITKETAKQVQSIMHRVVYDKEGTARFYQIPEVEILAKTGTSEIASQTGGYLDNQTITSVVVALPADDPKYIIYYAFESEYDVNTHLRSEAVQNILRKVAMMNNLTSEPSSPEGETVLDVIETYDMPDVVNHSLTYATDKLHDKSSNIVVLGQGSQVVDQYPKAKQSLVSNQRVFLITDLSDIRMPNMIGWTRKDVSEFWLISGMAFKIDGYGHVKSQSISEGSELNKDYLIEVYLE